MAEQSMFRPTFTSRIESHWQPTLKRDSFSETQLGISDSPTDWVSDS